jgi:DNA ligase-1
MKSGLIWRFGPPVAAFEGLQRSTRHKSGLAMRFPRVNRLRWDKPPGEADRLERLETMIARIEQGRMS